MRIIIPGQPTPKARARTFVRGGFTQTFDPQYKKKAEVRKQIEAQCTEHFTEEPLIIKYEFHIKPANSNTPAERNLKLWGLASPQKPDIDNLEKFALDCMNAIVYSDDSQIVESHAIKKFSQNPCTIIDIEIKNYLDVSNHNLEVLKIMSPDEMKDFFEDCENVFYWDSPEIENHAYSIKQFADKWAKTLTKISKCKAAVHDNKEESESYREGKTLC